MPQKVPNNLTVDQVIVFRDNGRMTKQIATEVQEMNVFIVNYRGTVYGVFSTREKASLFAELKFGRNAVMCLDVIISSAEVDSIEL